MTGFVTPCVYVQKRTKISRGPAWIRATKTDDLSRRVGHIPLRLARRRGPQALSRLARGRLCASCTATIGLKPFVCRMRNSRARTQPPKNRPLSDRTLVGLDEHAVCRTGLPCQEAFDCRIWKRGTAKPVLIAAIAPGTGRVARAGVGAALAVSALLNILEEDMAGYLKSDRLAALLRGAVGEVQYCSSVRPTKPAGPSATMPQRCSPSS